MYYCRELIKNKKKLQYMGDNVLWIKSDTLEHESTPFVLADVAELQEEIHIEYGLISATIVATVTDNASNFAKTFKEFTITVVSEEQDETLEQEQDLSYIMIDRDEEEMSDCAIILPLLIRCVTYTLSLVSTTDTQN